MRNKWRGGIVEGEEKKKKKREKVEDEEEKGMRLGVEGKYERGKGEREQKVKKWRSKTR